jgi:hypothetical protein
MKYIKYTFLALFSLPFTLLALLLAPILPLFASMKEGNLDNGGSTGIGPRLPSWLSLFQTPDNSLYGDSSFIAINGTSYLSQVKWLLRNPCYSYGLRVLTDTKASFCGDNKIKDNDNAIAGWCFVTASDLFQFTLVQPIGFSRCIYVNLGWNVRALVDANVNPKPNPYTATFVFSPRISGFR